MKKLVLTQCVGKKYEPVRQIVYPNFKSYAYRIGADFHSIEDRYHESIVMDKLRIADLLADYDRILWLDADLIVRPDCPDLFSLVPADRLGGYDEGCGSLNEDARQLRFSVAAHIGEFYKLPQPYADKKWIMPDGRLSMPYFNVGVLVVSKEHEPIFRANGVLKAPPEEMICPEQGYINYRIWDVKPKLFHLPVCFNQMPYNRTSDYLQCSYIVHFAGCGMKQRMEGMRQGLAVWDEEHK